MIRRNPTRIELTLDDIEEYKNLRVKQDNEAKRAATRLENPSNLLDTSTVGDASSSNGANTNNPETRAENIHERIGFNPLPRNT
jgi:hypothetical protein